MLEIKNVVSRVITGIPKEEYWIQMQLQMNICDLNECDFLETRFLEYENYDDYISDGNFIYTKLNKLKGIIMCFLKDEELIYEYKPLLMNKKEYIVWEQTINKKYNDATWVRNIYWHLDYISCVLVLRNKRWFKQVVPIFKQVWDNILLERESGYNHRKPKSKLKIEKKSVCLIKL